MIRQPITKRRTQLLGMCAMLGMLLGYSALSHFQRQRNPNDTTMPSLRECYDGIRRAAVVSPATRQRYEGAREDNPAVDPPDSWLWADIKATGARLFAGLALAIIGAIILGISMGCFRKVEALLLPPVTLLAKVPPTAAMAVFFVLVGTDLNMFIAMIVFGVLPTMGQTVYIAAREVLDEYLYKAYTLGATNTETIWNVVTPLILPRILDAIRLAIGPAVVYLIAAEMLCCEVGFGYRIRLQARLLNMDIVYPYLLILAAFGLTMDYGLRFLQRAACPWYVREE